MLDGIGIRQGSDDFCQRAQRAFTQASFEVELTLNAQFILCYAEYMVTCPPGPEIRGTLLW